MNLIKKQFFGPWTWYVLSGIAATHLLAVFVRDTVFALPVLVFIAIAVFVVTLKSLPHGLFVGFAEIFIGGHGHLLNATVGGFSVSLRMVLFVAILAAWAILWLKKEIQIEQIFLRNVPWLLLLLAVVVGVLIGFANNDPGNAFDDANGYLAIGYLLPVLSIRWKALTKRQLLQTLSGSVLWLVIFTLGLSFAFNHLDGKTLSHVYTFVRDARLAEVTLQKKETYDFVPADYCEIIDSEGLPECDGPVVSYYWYRIFMQSHFYVVTMFLLLFSAMLFLWRDQRVPFRVDLAFSLLASVLVVSYSRSFTLGLACGALLLLVLAFFHGKKPIKNVILRSVLFVVLLSFAGLIAAGSALVPPKPDITKAAFYETSGNIDRDLAISSRWQLLPEMMEEIYLSPFIGRGFGTEVTFISDDPRVRAIDPSGEWTTYRFEWGWQDIWLKMGILGLIAFAAYAAVMIHVTTYTIKKHGHVWLSAGLGAGLVMLFVAHVFTPFLNHPIGLVAMMLPIPFLDWRGWSERLAEVRKTKRIKAKQLNMSPAMRVKNEQTS